MSFIRYVLQIFFPVCTLSFYSLNSVFCHKNNLIKVNLCNYILDCGLFSVYFVKGLRSVSRFLKTFVFHVCVQLSQLHLFKRQFFLH